MSRTPLAQISVTVVLAGWLAVCLLCQGSPQTAHAHHEGSADFDRGCDIVAEVAPSQVSVEPQRCSDQTDDLHLTTSHSAVAVLGSGHSAFRGEFLSTLKPANLYQLHRVYRL